MKIYVSQKPKKFLICIENDKEGIFMICSSKALNYTTHNVHDKNFNKKNCLLNNNSYQLNSNDIIEVII